MLKHALSAGLALSLLVPAAAFAQEAPAEPAPADEPTALDELADALDSLASIFSAAKEEQDGPDADAEAFEQLVEDLEAVLADTVSGFVFEAAAVEATDEAEEDEDAEGADGEAVSTVAHCAPRGSFKALVEGMATHGEYVTAAARGETVGLFVPIITFDDEGNASVGAGTEATEFDLSTVAGAEALCDALDVVYSARLLQLELAWENVDTSKDARQLAREQCHIERLRADSPSDANEVCAELRDRVRDQLSEERDARAEARSEAKAARDEARAAKRAEHGSAKSGHAKKGGDDDGDDQDD